MNHRPPTINDQPFTINAFARRWHEPSGYREVLALAGPLVLSTGTTTVQQFVNRMFLSWYSSDALAASLPAGALSFTVMCFFIGTVSYASTFVAQYHGSGQPDRIAASVWQAIYLSLFAGIAILPFAAASRWLFDIAGHADQIRDQEVRYFTVLVLGSGFAVLSSATCAFFTGLGHTRTVMWVNVGTALLTAVLDYGLIFGNLGLPELGIVGAGLATVISSAVGALIFVYLFIRGRHSAQYQVWLNRGFDRDLFGRLLRFGAPSGFHFMVDLLGWSLFIMLVGRLGVTELAATNLAFQVNNIIFLPMIGFSVATSTLVGRRLGEDRPDLAARATWSAFHMTFSYMAFLALLYVTIPGPFIAPFAAGADPAQFEALRAMTVILLRFVALYSLFDSANLIFSAALKGAGDTVFVMVVSAVLGMGLMVVPTWYVCHTGEGSIWTAWTWLATFVIVLAFFFVWRFLQGKWRSMRVTSTHHAPISSTYPHPDAPPTDAEVV